MDYRIGGALLNSALYLWSIVWFGFMTGHQIASLVAIGTMGVAYLAYTVEIVSGVRRSMFLTWLSNVLGVIAGFMLLF